MSHVMHDLRVQSDLGRGENTVDELAERAAALGIDRLAVCDRVEARQQVQELRSRIEQADAGDVEVYTGVEIKAENVKELQDKISAFRDDVDIVAVHGGDEKINRAAAGDTRVDILAHPERGRRDSGIDHVIAKRAAENRVAIELEFRSLLTNNGKKRTHILSHMGRNIRLAGKFGAPVVINSGARRMAEMRKPRDMMGVARCLGKGEAEAYRMIEDDPAAILDRSAAANRGGRVGPGVEVEEG